MMNHKIMFPSFAQSQLAGYVVVTSGASSLGVGVVRWNPISAKSSISSISFACSKSNLDNQITLPVGLPHKEYDNGSENLIHDQPDNTVCNGEPYP